MITEDYVSFEVAKLLKEKGFNEECYAYWHEDENKLIISRSAHAIQNITNPCFFGPAAPTHQMALKHLRKTYKVHFKISYRANRYVVFIMTIEALPRYICRGITGETYEEAVDKALKYYLTNQIYI